MLKVRDLVVGYGDLEVLHGVSLEVEPGQIVCLIGPNGSGKSTLLNALFSLVKPWQGQVHYRGQEITGRDPGNLLRQGIAYVLQRRSVFPQLSVYENLQMGAFIRNDDGVATDIERVFEIFPVLKQKQHHPAQAMSGGEQRMLELGRALMIRPQLLLLDEPSAGLAPKVIDEIFAVLRRLNEEERLTLVIVEQNVRRILEFADYGYLLNQGQVELHGPCDELLSTEKLVKAFLSY
ncbi:MAG: ABC transporter ATP-binding protein [Candidatus Bipolaricaulia bacterium]